VPVAGLGGADKKKLALLHLFQGFVDVDVLRVMGDPEADWCLPEVRGLTREAGIALLDRAAEIGLLSAHGSGYYSIHPAVPWFFRGMFEKHYPANKRANDGSNAMIAAHAYVVATGEFGKLYHNHYNEGYRDHLTILEAAEPNLLHARDLALRHGWRRGVIGAMQGLHMLYVHSGRRAEWARLVDDVKNHFVNASTDGPLPDREDEWATVNEYRVHLALEARRWAEAERLQQAYVRWIRERAAAALTVPSEALDDAQRHMLRQLAFGLGLLGQIQRDSGQTVCLTSYSDATEVARRAGDQDAEARNAFNLGSAYMYLPTIRNLDEAERWYLRSLDMYDSQQHHYRSKCMGQLGAIAHKRFNEARATKRPEMKILEHINAALRFYHEALRLLPINAVADLAVVHAQLGNIYGDADDLDRALPHYQDSIRYDEKQNNLYGAAQTRYSVAWYLALAGRLANARAYALAALRNFETYGDRAADKIQNTRNLLAEIDRRLTPSQPT
jgi:tetratricopeptide (TPR) repeat protein